MEIRPKDDPKMEPSKGDSSDEGAMDSKVIADLEQALEEERRKIHAKADEALPLAKELQVKVQRLADTGRIRVKTPSNPKGIKLPVKLPSPESEAG